MKRQLTFVWLASALALMLIPFAFVQKSNVAASNLNNDGPMQDQSRSDVTPTTKPGRQGPPNVGITAPTNDNCASAVAVASCPFTDTRSNAGATTETGEPVPCGAIGATMWYSYTNSLTNPVVVNVATCTGTTVDTVLAAYKVTGAACAFPGFVNVGCNDDFCGNGLQSTIEFVADPGATYKIQVGGFAGSSGSITVNVTCTELKCPDIVVNGVLGSGSPNRPGFSGQQTPNRLFRDGVPSTCAVPKLICPGTFNTGSFTFDAYPFTNASGQSQCVTVLYDPDSPASACGPNAHATVYLSNYNPGNVCQFYLADVGASTTLSFSFTVPAGATFFVVIAANSPGVGTGCHYKYTVRGNICVGFDVCVQDDNNPKRFVQINTITGAYKFTDCGKGLTLSGIGGVASYFCKTELFDQGPNPKKPDRFVDVQVNPCTKVGDAIIQFGGNTIILHDSNTTNNTCACPGA